MKKVKGIVIVIVIAAAIFGILVAIERNAVNQYERVEMAVAVKEVPKGTKLTEENVGEYFEMRKCDASLNTQYNIKELGELEGKYLNRQIYANTIVHAYDFSDSDFKNEAIKEKVLVSFGVGSLADSLSGTLRMGDVVNIYVVHAQTGEISSLTGYPVIIEEAFDSSGILIGAGDKTSIATNFNISVDKSDESAFYEIIATGNVKVVKVDEY